MGHLENKLEWCIRKAEKEGEKHRGLKEVDPDEEKASKHIEKANHNLKAMLYLVKGNFPDWAVNASFYAMYHCFLAVLAKYGYESRNQECTFTVVEHLIKNKKLDIDVKWIKKIGSFDESELEGDEIIKLREKFQYEIETTYEEDKMKLLVKDTKEFIRIVRESLKK
jgi:uncharacterized protein (UPF0332 family)